MLFILQAYINFVVDLLLEISGRPVFCARLGRQAVAQKKAKGEPENSIEENDPLFQRMKKAGAWKVWQHIQ